MSNGPYTNSNGTKIWYKSQSKLFRLFTPFKLAKKFHREDGPAIIYSDGTEHYFLDDNSYTKPNYYQELFNRGLIGEDALFLELI